MKNMRFNIRLILLVVTLCLFVLFNSIRVNWSLRARFNLALHGHISPRLISPQRVGVIPSHFPRGLVGVKLVYVGDRYIGYLDKYALFIPVSAQKEPPAKQEQDEFKDQAISDVLPVGLEILSGVVCCILIISLLWNKLPRVAKRVAQ